MAMDREYLEEQRGKDYALLKELEDEYRLEGDPKRLAKLERDIQMLEEQIQKRESELESLPTREPFQLDAVVLKQYADKYQSRYGLLKLLGMPQAVELESVYTQVRFLDDLSIRRFESIKALEEEYRKSQERRFQVGRKVGNQDGIAVANQHQYLMVLGGPGAGKTTFLRKLGLEALKGNNGCFKHHCIPVLLELKQFTDEVDLTIAIAREFQYFGLPSADEFATKALEQGKLLVLLDGLDEVSVSSVNTVIDAIQQLVIQYDRNRFVASCRIAGYRSGGFQRFRDIELADFDDHQIQQFIQKWFSSELDKKSKTAEECWRLLSHSKNQAAKELAQTPLLLTLLCIVYHKSLMFPKDRAALYGDALNVLMKEWSAEKRVQHDPIYHDLSPELEKLLLSEIACTSFSEDQPFFRKQEIAKQIKHFLVDNLNAPKYLDSEAVLNAIEVQQGILVERARNIYSFSHLTLQEYLTAQYIYNEHQTKELVTEHLADIRWREIFLLVACMLPRADSLLMEMETAAQNFVINAKFQALLTWADRITARSERTHQALAQRTAAIYFVLSLNHDFSLTQEHPLCQAYDPILERIYNLALSLKVKFLNRVLYLSRAFCCPKNYRWNPIADYSHSYDQNFEHDYNYGIQHFYDHDRTAALSVSYTLSLTSIRRSTLEHALDYVRVYAFRDLKIFGGIDFEKLIEHLKALESKAPARSSSAQINQTFIEQIYQIWFDTFEIEPAWLEFSQEEANAFYKYLYTCELIVRCKESAVRVSRDTWEGIEKRMLLPHPHP